MGNFHYLSIHLSMNQDLFLLCNAQHCVLFAFADGNREFFFFISNGWIVQGDYSNWEMFKLLSSF